jgi:hypothetical protein
MSEPLVFMVEAGIIVFTASGSRRACLLISLIPEDEERTFGDLRSISEKTSNRQAPLVVDNCMLRCLAKEKRNDRSENFKKQESMISKQARLLPDAVNTIIPASTIKTRGSLMQAHCRRISDYLVLGENVQISKRAFLIFRN